MIKVENIETWGFKHAIRGMRNPLNSWNKSDSTEDKIGKNDLDLMKRLYKAGTEHRKYLRQIFVSMDITAPLYWWKEMETYRINVTSNSCSTMHKIHSEEITVSDFSFENFDLGKNLEFEDLYLDVIGDCETLRKLYVGTKDVKYWRALIQLLPESYNQKRTITMNYENVVNILKQRKGHKLTEWNKFCAELEDSLPYLKEIMED